jgi:large subunit ribosomal protein L5
MNKLRQEYQEKIVSKLQQELGLGHPMAVPKLKKITLNTSSNDLGHDSELLENTKTWMGAITGQTPRVTRARKAIAGFNIREGDIVGVSVTLRGDRMYDFYQKLVHLVLPQTKDFQGVPRSSINQQGTYTLGLKEQLIFPEVEYDKINRIQGLEISISTTAKDPIQAEALLRELGMPFVKETEE